MTLDDDGHQVDVHPVVFNWIYPRHGFSGSGHVLGRGVPCLTAEVMMLCHATGYALDRVHQDDVVALSEGFGIPIPASATLE